MEKNIVDKVLAQYDKHRNDALRKEKGTKIKGGTKWTVGYFKVILSLSVHYHFSSLDKAKIQSEFVPGFEKILKTI